MLELLHYIMKGLTSTIQVSVVIRTIYFSSLCPKNIWNEHIHDGDILKRDVITADKNFQITPSTYSISLPSKWNLKLSNRLLVSGVSIKKKPKTPEVSEACHRNLYLLPMHGRRGTKKPRHSVHSVPAHTAAHRLLPVTSVVLLTFLTHKEMVRVSEIGQMLDKGWKAHHTYLAFLLSPSYMWDVISTCRNW